MKRIKVDLDGGYFVYVNCIIGKDEVIFIPDGREKYVVSKEIVDNKILVYDSFHDLFREYNHDGSEVEDITELIINKVIPSYVQFYVYPTDFWLQNNYDPAEYVPTY